jgi:hypothetical protein
LRELEAGDLGHRDDVTLLLLGAAVLILQRTAQHGTGLPRIFGAVEA